MKKYDGDVKNSKKNICDTCRYCIADCKAENIIYGDGIGNNNVIACDGYIRDETQAMSSISFTGEIINYLNEKAEAKFRTDIVKTRRLMAARIKEGFREEDFKKVVDNMTVLWKNNPTMNRFLRPETLFGTKFESYLNTKITASDKGNVSVEAEKTMHAAEEWLNERKEA